MAKLSQSVIPLFRRASDGHPEHYASGTLLKFGDAGFLATARHCLDTVADQGVFVPADGEIVGVEARGSRCEEPFDLGYLRLSPDVTARLERSAHFLTADFIDPDDLALPNSHYAFVGFPWRQTTRAFGPKRFKYQTHMFTGKSFTIAELTARGLDPRIHIAIEFDRENVKMPDGTFQTAPLPEGMSGGAVFNVRRDPGRTSGIEMRIAGLGTYHDPHQLQGVRLAALLHLIREEHLDIAGHVPVSRRYVFGPSTPVAPTPGANA
jgi:hypothetical protein